LVWVERAIAALVSVLVSVSGIGSAAGGGATATRAATPRAVELSTLSDAQLAGQRVIYSYSGLTPPTSLLAKVRAGQAAGVIFFGANIASRAQIGRVAAELQAAARQSPVRLPLLLMTDQEGGEVRRLPGEPTLSEKQIGAAKDAAMPAQAGRGARLNLKGAGLNVNLAPVLDVYRVTGDFDDQFGRSYSRNPRTVARLGAAFIKAQQPLGVTATAKHFPGLGAASASQNTDERPVTLNVSLKQLRAVDELPYLRAIKAGLKLAMVSWATYPALDRTHPAGLSATIVEGELRGRLKFSGVTITDGLEAGALQPFGSISRRALLAARAGMDLMLCTGQSDGAAATGALATALKQGKLGRLAFLASVQRILALRAARVPGPA
jgi:beta-N-acetylhexosaminidase